MTYYRKKPVVIEAWRLIEGADMPDWIEHAFHTGELILRNCGTCIVKTLEDGPDNEATHIASPGDWIVRGICGELYPCKNDIFEQTYEPVTCGDRPLFLINLANEGKIANNAAT